MKKVYISAFSIGTGPVPWVVMSEVLTFFITTKHKIHIHVVVLTLKFFYQIFPIHIKGVAGSLVVLVNWLGAWLISFTFNYMMAWSSAGKKHHSSLHSQKKFHQSLMSLKL